MRISLVILFFGIVSMIELSLCFLAANLRAKDNKVIQTQEIRERDLYSVTYVQNGDTLALDYLTKQELDSLNEQF